MAFRKNELTGRTDVVKRMPWNAAIWKGDALQFTDNDECNLRLYLEEKYNQTKDRCISTALNIIVDQNKYHPVREYLETLKWDGQERIRYALQKFFGAADDEYVHEMLRMHMLAAISRVYNPGIKYDTMLCLVGGQGAGKSTFYRMMAIKDEWFSDDLKRLEDDNVYRKLQGHWFIEMAEMSATVNARSIEEIKSFLSRQKDNYKIPYERHPEDRPRQCVFCGTSNTLDFLPFDRTGNRRFVPILIHPEKAEVHLLADERSARAYIIQMWAEAIVIYKEGNFRLTPSKEMEKYLQELQRDFMPEDTKSGIVQEFLDNYKEDFVCSRVIYAEAFHHEYDEPKVYELREISNIMNNAVEGWQYHGNHRFGGRYGTQRAWKRINDSVDEDGFVKVPEQTKLPFD